MSEFAEVAHSGGQVKFTISTDTDGRTGYQVSISSDRPVPVAMIALYALEAGIPVAPVKRLGWGNMEAPPFMGCVLVLIASDSEGLFGHKCPRCQQYWRSGPWPDFCPYCALATDSLNFLSEAQVAYVQHYCSVLNEALRKMEDGEVTIDMDAVADATVDPSNRPDFYVSEESQQHKFKCKSCNAFNDIIGSFGYCCQCATRNDLAVFENSTVPKLRDRLNADHAPEDCIRDAIAATDTFIGQYASQLEQHVPLTKARRSRLTKGRFHDLGEFVGMFRDWFGFDPLKGIGAPDTEFATLMFHRRHVYEHKGGEADEKYIRDSGETGVRLKQRLRNSKEDGHRLLGILQRLASNVHAGFHELLPPAPEPIANWQERQTRMKRRA